jgi:polysaccharide export outer membrane protein
MAKTLVWALLLGLFFLPASFSLSAQDRGGVAPASPQAAALTIGPGDLVEIAMFDAPELSGRFRVDEAGNIAIPMLGAVHVQGLTAEQAAKLVQQRYVAAEILKPESSQVTVFIEEYASQGITVSGDVKTPGVYPAFGVRMLNDVITAAGGVLPTASSQVLIARRNDLQHPVTVEYNPTALKPIIPDVQILPGDSILVPRAGIVYVIGDVNKPGGYVLDGRNTLTVEEAMGLAGGPGHAAKMHDVQLVRQLPDGRKEMIEVPVDLIFTGKSPDIALKDQDIVYVPVSTRKLVIEQALSSALSIGTQFTVYRTAYGNQ